MRQFFEIVLPLILPSALYFGYVLLARARGATVAPEMPWIWLGLAGGLLLAVTFVAIAVFGGASPSDVYLPPRIINGVVQPGHFAPANN